MVTKHAHHPPKESPTAFPNAGDPVLTVAPSVARAITASHRLFPVTSTAYDRRRARQTSITHGPGAGTSAPDPFSKNHSDTECSQWSQATAKLPSPGTVPPIPWPGSSWPPRILVGGSRMRQPSHSLGALRLYCRGNYWLRQHPLPNDRRRWPGVSGRTRLSGSRSARAFPLTTRSSADPFWPAPTTKNHYPRRCRISGEQK